jgi:hypothetical protein
VLREHSFVGVGSLSSEMAICSRGVSCQLSQTHGVGVLSSVLAATLPAASLDTAGRTT